MSTLATALVYVVWNLVLDAVVLYLAFRLRGRPLTWRIGLGAVLGSAYALVPVPFSGGLLGHLACALAMCLVAGSYRGLGDLGVEWLCLLGATLALGGLTLGLALALTGRVPTAAHPAPALTALTAGLALVATERAGAAFVLRRWAKAAVTARSLTVDLGVRMGERSITLRGLLDTGNRLRDPVTGSPVVIVDRGTLLRLLPEEGREAFLQVLSAPDAIGAARTGGAALPGIDAPVMWTSRIHVVPYETIGRGGLLTAVRPDRVWELADGRERMLGLCLLGLSPTPLAPGVDAIVSPSLWGASGARCRERPLDPIEAWTMGA